MGGGERRGDDAAQRGGRGKVTPRPPRRRNQPDRVAQRFFVIGPNSWAYPTCGLIDPYWARFPNVFPFAMFPNSQMQDLVSVQ